MKFVSTVDTFDSEEMIRVLFLIDTLEVGGTERSILEISRRFEETQATVCHVFRGDVLKPEYEENGLEVISINEPGNRISLSALSCVRKVVSKVRPQVIHSALYRASILGRIAAGMAGIPHVDSLVNDSYGRLRFERLSRSRRAKLRAVQLLDRATVRLADVFVANSAAIAESNRQALGIPRDRIRVIHRGRDPRSLMATREEAAEVRTELILRDRPMILNVARLRERKGQRELIQAMDQILRSAPKAVLVIAGEGPFLDELERLRDGLGLGNHVVFLGRRDDVPALLAAADVFVFPSHYEGLPGALIEAMFAGVPIVASDTPMHRECLDEGVSGALFPVGDPDALAAAVVWAMGQPEESALLGQRAQQTATEKFHIDKVARQHEELYQELIDRRGKCDEDSTAH